MTFVMDGKRMRLRKPVRIALWTILTILLVLAAVSVFTMTVLQVSFKYFPALPEEIEQMSVIERWFFAR